MPTFNYKAKNQAGNTVSGAVEAVDSKAAAGKIREMGYWPLDVGQDGEPLAQSPRTPRAFVSPLWNGVSLRSLALFFRQLGTMLGAGLSLSEALDSLGRQHGMGRLPVIAREAADHIRQGGAFSQVMERHYGVFTPLQAGLVRAGEAGGMMDSMIVRIADYLERELALRQKISRATFYPKIIAFFILVVALFAPRIQEIVEHGTPVVERIFLGSVLPLLAICVMIYVAIKFLLRIPPVSYAWDGFKLAVPILGATARKLAMSRFCSSVSVMYAAGLPMGQAVEISSDTVGNEVIRRKILGTVPILRSGIGISEAFRSTGALPDMVMSMLSTGERTGSIDQVLNKVTEYYDAEAESTLEKFSYLLFALLIVGAAIVVLPLLVRLYSSLIAHEFSAGGG